ncbi:MAG: aminoacyl-tRNA hydrolase [Oligoflexia bacterium]|nr:aminoacyl-tRNA hydrolase [Oligoflexia bacterium]
MKVLAGLGNPGRQHLFNRHNLGFLAIDAYMAFKGFSFEGKRFQSEFAKVKVGSQDVLVLKPQTYMNRSGEAIGEALRFFKLKIEDLIVVHDEIDLPAKSFRLKQGGGHGGNNGLRSIIPIGENFIRVRMGVGRPTHPGYDVADYVLGDLEKEELDFWQNEMTSVIDAVDLCLENKLSLAMNKFNRRD